MAPFMVWLRVSFDSERDGDVSSGSGYARGGGQVLFGNSRQYNIYSYLKAIHEGMNLTRITRVLYTVRDYLINRPKKVCFEGNNLVPYYSRGPNPLVLRVHDMMGETE